MQDCALLKVSESGAGPYQERPCPVRSTSTSVDRRGSYIILEWQPAAFGVNPIPPQAFCRGFLNIAEPDRQGHPPNSGWRAGTPPRRKPQQAFTLQTSPRSAPVKEFSPRFSVTRVQAAHPSRRVSSLAVVTPERFRMRTRNVPRNALRNQAHELYSLRPSLPQLSRPAFF